jgi:hypothetical protein
MNVFTLKCIVIYRRNEKHFLRVKEKNDQFFYHSCFSGSFDIYFEAFICVVNEDKRLIECVSVHIKEK